MLKQQFPQLFGGAVVRQPTYFRRLVTTTPHTETTPIVRRHDFRAKHKRAHASAVAARSAPFVENADFCNGFFETNEVTDFISCNIYRV